MRKELRRWLWAVATLMAAMVSAGIARAEDPTAVLIRAFVEFQADRVESMALDSFVGDLAHEQFFKQYFPQTSSAVAGYHDVSGQRLLPLMQFYFQSDLDGFQAMAICLNGITADLKEAGQKSGQELIDAAASSRQRLVKYVDDLIKFRTDRSMTVRRFLDSQGCALSDAGNVAGAAPAPAAAAAPGGAPAPAAVTTSAELAIRTDARIPLALRNKLLLVDLNQKSLLAEAPAHPPAVAQPAAAELAPEVKAVLRAWTRVSLSESVRNTLEANKVFAPDELRVVPAPEKPTLKFLFFGQTPSENPATTPAGTTGSTPSDATPEQSFAEALLNFATLVKSGKKMPTAVRVHNLMSALDALGVQDGQNAAYSRFRSGGLFLASLSDAGEKADVAAAKQAIKAFVRDDGAARSKRTDSGILAWRSGLPTVYCTRWVTCGDNLFIGSYVGAVTGYVADGAGGHEWQGRPFGPVGLELKLFTIYGASVSLTAAPYDVGAYVASELRGAAYTPKFEDIKAPSYFLSYSMRNRPVAWLLGYQENLEVSPGVRDDAAFIGVAFDLPVYRIH